MSLTVDASFTQAATAIAQQLGANNQTAVLLLTAWSYCEKPHGAGDGWQWNNPLNTTEPGYGETGSVNSAGVKMYATRADGVSATVATLLNGRYPTLVAGLRQGNAALFFSAPSQMATWGTSAACVRTDYLALGGRLTASSVSGRAAPAPGPTPSTPGRAVPLWMTLAAGGLLFGGLLVVAGVETAQDWPGGFRELGRAAREWAAQPL